MSDGKSFTADQVAAKAKNNRLRMTEAEAKAINPKGHREWIDDKGKRQWANKYTTNVNGELTPVAKAVIAAQAPFIKAERERHAENQARIERVALHADSGVQYVTPDREREAVERNGWRPRFRGRATRTYRGGKWYVRDRGEWREE